MFSCGCLGSCRSHEPWLSGPVMRSSGALPPIRGLSALESLFALEAPLQKSRRRRRKRMPKAALLPSSCALTSPGTCHVCHARRGEAEGFNASNAAAPYPAALGWNTAPPREAGVLRAWSDCMCAYRISRSWGLAALPSHAATFSPPVTLMSRFHRSFRTGSPTLGACDAALAPFPALGAIASKLLIDWPRRRGSMHAWVA